MTLCEGYLFFVKKENAGDFPVDENGKVLFSDVHFTETYEVNQYLKNE